MERWDAGFEEPRPNPRRFFASGSRSIPRANLGDFRQPRKVGQVPKFVVKNTFVHLREASLVWVFLN